MRQLTIFTLTLAMLLAIHLPVSAEESNFIPLPKNFTEDFNIGKTNEMSGRMLFTAEIDGFQRILLFDIDNRKIIPVIDGPGNNSFPSWSPDGKRLSFTSDRDGNSEIYTANLETGSLKRITNNNVSDDNASWSEDGSELVFYSEISRDGNKLHTNLFSYSLQTEKIEQITNFKSGKNSTPRMSPDGRLIAFSTNRFWPGWDICVWNRAKKSEKCILSGTKSYCRPMWSASGKLLAYSGGSFSKIGIEIYNLETQVVKTITDLPGKEYDVVWAPNGKALAFAAEVDGGRFNIFIDRQLKSNPLLISKHSLRYLSWSPFTTIELEAARVKENPQETQAPEKLLHPLIDAELESP